jgi:hypothetical protein
MQLHKVLYQWVQLKMGITLLISSFMLRLSLFIPLSIAILIEYHQNRYLIVQKTAYLVLGLIFLFFFGVLMDVVHYYSYGFIYGLGVIEDGGQMVVMSCILYLVYLDTIVGSQPAVFKEIKIFS